MNEINKKYSVIVPVYRSEKTLHELVQRIQNVFESIASEYEIILVEDCGGDGSWEIMQKLHEDDHRVKIIQLMNNFGQHNAIMCGFHYAKGEYIITMDDDLQNPPEEITKLIKKINEGYDIVYGEYLTKQHSIIRNMGSSLIQLIYKKVFDVQNNLTAFRIIRRDIIQSILRFDKSFVFIDGLLAWSSKKIGTVSVVHDKRPQGKSGYSIIKLFTLSFNMVTNFSILPLQIASFLGYLFAFMGLCMAIYFSFKKIFYDIPVTGYASLIVAITIFAGVQLVTIGLIGEYLGRIHLNINSKPQYIIRQSNVS